MTALAWVISLIAAGWLGWRSERLWNQIDSIWKVINTRVVKKKEFEKKVSTFIDPEDILQRAKWEQEEAMRKLNTDE